MKGYLLCGLVAAAVVGAIAYEVMLWRECLDTNSVWYCMRVLTR